MKHAPIERREFLLHGTAAGAALSLGMLGAACDRRADDATDTGNASARAWPGTVVQAGEGELVISGRRRARMRIKVDSRIATGATMSMIVSEVAPGAEIPVHLHRNEDELIFIHTGAGLVTLGDRQVPSTAGAVLYAPRGVWHGIENTGPDSITWCAIYSPPGFERFFVETGVAPGGETAPPNAEEVAAIAARYGMVFRDS